MFVGEYDSGQFVLLIVRKRFRAKPVQAFSSNSVQAIPQRVHCDTKKTRFIRLFMPKLVSERIKKLREEIAEISEANRKICTGEMEGQPPTTNGGFNDCRKFWISL